MKISKKILLGSATAMLLAPSMLFAQTGATPPAGDAMQSMPATTATPGGAPQSANQPTSANGSPNAGVGTLAQGQTVYDTNGGTVGTIDAIQGEFATLATTKSKVRLPKTSFAMGAKGPVIGMTAAQLDQAAAQAAPQASASGTASAKPDVVKGAAVADMQGGAVGTVEDVDTRFATVTLTTGGKVRLPVTAFGAGTDGGLRVAMTAAQLSAAAGVAKGG